MDREAVLAAEGLGLADSPFAALRVRAVDDRAEWEALFQRVEQPHLTQAWLYGEAKRVSGGWGATRLVFERAGKPVAICQVLEKRVLGVPVVHRINRGPLFLGAPSADTASAVLSALRRRWRWLTNGVLLVAPALEASDDSRRILAGAGFRARRGEGWQSSVLDLRKDEDALRKGLTSAWRNHLKVSERSGMMLFVSSSAETVEWMLARHADNMRAKGFVGPAADLVRTMFADRPGDCLVFQVLHAGAAVAGAFVVTFGQRAEYYLAWYSEAGRKLSAGNFLVWNAALEMRRRGCAGFDLGGYGTREKYGKFKEGMRGAEYRLAGEWIAF
jgi:CelD/BcsL family acetyltransferase involved in cellulose biosynthesis